MFPEPKVTRSSAPPNISDAEPCALTSPKILDYLDARHQVETDALTDAKWGTAFDPDPLFCTNGVCPIESDGVFRYLDGNHMTATFSRSLAPALRPFVTQLLPSGG